MKKQMMAAFAFSAMMTLSMPFASFAAGRSCPTAFRPGNSCSYRGNSTVSVIRIPSGCTISNLNVSDVYRMTGTGCAGGTCKSTCNSGTNCNTSCGTNSCGNLIVRR